MAEWYPVARTGEVVEGLPVLVSVNGRDICLLRYRDGFYAISDICTHAEASLSEGEQRGPIIECPRHGGQFDITTGAAVHYPAFEPVETFPVKVDGDTIQVQVEP
jgi:nitrite reductase/ring-hydroxylating ferredoxin subunit